MPSGNFKRKKRLSKRLSKKRNKTSKRLSKRISKRRTKKRVSRRTKKTKRGKKYKKLRGGAAFFKRPSWAYQSAAIPEIMVSGECSKGGGYRLGKGKKYTYTFNGTSLKFFRKDGTASDQNIDNINEWTWETKVPSGYDWSEFTLILTKKDNPEERRVLTLKAGDPLEGYLDLTALNEKNAFRDFEIIMEVLGEDIDYTGLTKEQMEEKFKKILELRYHYSKVKKSGRFEEIYDFPDFWLEDSAFHFIAVLEKIMDNNPQNLWEEVLTGMIESGGPWEYGYNQDDNLIADIIGIYIQMLKAKGVEVSEKFSENFIKIIGRFRPYPFKLEDLINTMGDIEKRRLESLEKTERGKLAAAKLRLIQARMLKGVGLPAEIADAVHEATKTVSTTPAAIESTLRTHLQPAGIRSDMTLEEKIAEYDRLIEENPHLTQFYEKAKQKAIKKEHSKHETPSAGGAGGGASRAGGTGASLDPS